VRKGCVGESGDWLIDFSDHSLSVTLLFFQMLSMNLPANGWFSAVFF
jgi:hypothetical protein